MFVLEGHVERRAATRVERCREFEGDGGHVDYEGAVSGVRDDRLVGVVAVVVHKVLAHK